MHLRVMTYNILNGGETRETQILDVIRTAKPDIVVLQEVFHERLLQFLAHSLGMTYWMGTSNHRHKVALLSNYPVHSFTSHHPIFPIWRNFIDAEIEYKPNEMIRVIGVHPIAILGLPFEIWRLWEAKYVVRHIRDDHTRLCLIAGDFNAIAPGEKVDLEIMPGWLKWMIHLQGNRVYHFSIQTVLSAGFSDCFRLLNSDAGFTLPPPQPNSRLDYIFANDNLKAGLRKCWVMREPEVVNLASDHYPVMAEFSL